MPFVYIYFFICSKENALTRTEKSQGETALASKVSSWLRSAPVRSRLGTMTAACGRGSNWGPARCGCPGACLGGCVLSHRPQPRLGRWKITGTPSSDVAASFSPHSLQTNCISTRPGCKGPEVPPTPFQTTRTWPEVKSSSRYRRAEWVGYSLCLVV